VQGSNKITVLTTLNNGLTWQKDSVSADTLFYTTAYEFKNGFVHTNFNGYTKYALNTNAKIFENDTVRNFNAYKVKSNNNNIFEIGPHGVKKSADDGITFN
jgi:hypothetical protein